MQEKYPIKNVIYEKENMFLSPYATFSKNTKGRAVYEEECPMRTEFQRDRDRIIYSKSFLRLKNKTQVFFSPEGDHYMTRLTHTLDVCQIARSIARSLSLNEDLAEAIALGHDLGHTPFGHAGERVLNKLCENGFKHNEQSLRVVDKIEKLNLTFEVRDGILNHKITGNPQTLEGKAVSLSDRIAYLNHDVEDAIRAGVINANDIPKEVTEILGTSSASRINAMITSVYNTSHAKNTVDMSNEVKSAMTILREFMFERVYFNSVARGEEERASNMITELYAYFKLNPDKLPKIYKELLEDNSLDTVICDYISGMTDRYAVTVFKSIFVPKIFDLNV